MANVAFAAILGVGGLVAGLLEASGGYSDKISPGGLIIVTVWLAWGARLIMTKR